MISRTVNYVQILHAIDAPLRLTKKSSKMHRLISTRMRNQYAKLNEILNELFVVIFRSFIEFTSCTNRYKSYTYIANINLR